MNAAVRISQLVFGFMAASALAQDSWLTISTSKSSKFDVRAGSLERSVTAITNEPIAAVLVRVTDTNTRSVTFEKNYVRISDCEAGLGKLVTTDIDGGFKYHNDFILDGGNVASTIAGAICIAAGATARSNDIRPTPRF